MNKLWKTESRAIIPTSHILLWCSRNGAIDHYYFKKSHLFHLKLWITFLMLFIQRKWDALPLGNCSIAGKGGVQWHHSTFVVMVTMMSSKCHGYVDLHIFQIFKEIGRELFQSLVLYYNLFLRKKPYCYFTLLYLICNKNGSKLFRC